jgi:beta-glucosidase
VLAGFRRIHLKAGASQVVTIGLDARAQSQVDAQGVRKVRPGPYTVHAGGGQPGFVQAVAAKMYVAGELVLPK